jgi:flagellar basal-body rod protein FlgG
MVYGIYQSAGGLQVNQYRMDVLANNLANAETPGFKQDLTVVRERRTEAAVRMAGLDASDPRLRGMTGGSLVSPTVTSFEQGPIEKTGQPLDVALTGEGFFQIQGPGGKELYSRDGRFTVNDAGDLVTAAGNHKVLDDAGAPITIPADARGSLRIDAGGQLMSGDQVLGRLGIVAIDDTSLLAKTGSNLLESLGAKATPLTDASLETGGVDKSTVDRTRAMVSLIEVNRSYQLNATLIGLADSTLGRAVNDIARLR